ncbi:hypothetical protein OHB00_20255 [Streptomyces sp. NBC_00631]|uniref:hypothetical protein n=1 Tax=Streptomyces sp. NBC_00631 TaxID=2975793 RepID=UPI0030E3D6B0
MALIEKFESVTSDIQKMHGPVTCGVRSFAVDGQRILQLDTYGSADRQIHGKISQSVQLNITGARELIKIIEQVFPELSR